MRNLNRNIWIFGGTGFVGKALVKLLSSFENKTLNVLIHKNRPYQTLEHVNTFSGSLLQFNSDWFLKYRPDILFHLARPAGRNLLTRFLASLYGQIANARLIPILRTLPVPPVLVYVSGSLMYGPRSENSPALEDSDLVPFSFATPYSRIERPFLHARNKGFLDIRIARPGWILGPSSWFREFFWKPYLLHGKVPCYGDGTQLMSIIHLDDCAAFIAALGRKDLKNHDLNVFCGSPISQKKFSCKLAELLQATIQIVPFKETRRQYGKTVALALTSSIPLGTRYEDLHHNVQCTYPDLESMLIHVVGILKYEQ
ncbi:MAG: NAD(P)-dependent oxidoreductase [Bacteroidales bacterium]